MQTAMQFLFIGICLFVIFGACRYGRRPEITVLGIFASDGTRLDRPVSVPRSAIRISVSGRATVSGSTSDGLVITGPGRVTINA